MAGYYAYLLSSLPMLHFGVKPPITFEAFQAVCRGLVSDEELGLLEALGKSSLSFFSAMGKSSLSPFSEAGKSSLPPFSSDEAAWPGAVRAWVSFERMLRNELAKVRAARQHKEAGPYLRGDAGAEPAFTQLAVNASRHPDILESERMLDAARWQGLEAQCFGHYFDVDALMIYGLKLLILERWQRVRGADTQEALGGIDL